MPLHLKFSDFRERVESVEGLLAPGEEEYLFYHSHQVPDNGAIVEIGSYLGRSSVALGFPCLGTNKKVYCIDCWSDERTLESWKATISRLGLTNHVIPLRGYSGDILRDWVKLTGGLKIDMVFDDSSHLLPSILNEFVLIYPWVKESGVVAFHDLDHVDYPDVTKTWDLVKTLLGGHERFKSIALGKKVLVK